MTARGERPRLPVSLGRALRARQAARADVVRVHDADDRTRTLTPDDPVAAELLAAADALVTAVDPAPRD